MALRLVVLGAGIGGLACAWYLKKKFGADANVTILEKSDRAGGWIRSVRRDGFLFEQGPRSLRTKGLGLQTLKLIEELSLQDKVVVADPSAHIRYLYTNRQLLKVPDGLFSFFTSPLTRSLIPVLFKECFVPANHDPDESIRSFFTRRFNSEISENFIDPIVSGIYAGDIGKLSIRSCFPFLYDKEKKYGSIIKGLWSERKKPVISETSFIRSIQSSALFSFKEGLETLTQEMVRRIDTGILLRSEVKELTFSSSEVSVHFNDEAGNMKVMDADFVFSCLSARELGCLTRNRNPENLHIYSSPSASVAVVNLGYRKQVLKKKGFGYLIPSKEKETILGCVWDSCVFPIQNKTGEEETRITVMIGGMHHEKISRLSSEEMISLALDAIKKHLGIDSKPDCTMISLAEHAIPQYEVGYHAKMDLFKSHFGSLSKRLIISGNSITGVSVNDCIAGSERIVREFEFDMRNYGSP